VSGDAFVLLQQKSECVDRLVKTPNMKFHEKTSGGKCIVPRSWVDVRAGGMMDTRAHVRTYIHTSMQADRHT